MKSMSMTQINVYEGPNATKDFLNPGKCLPTPLVELPESANPFRADGVRIFAKLAYLSPLLNIKYLPVWNMLADAQSSGALEGVHTIVESSSGNAAFSLSVIARLFGVKRTIAYVPFDIAPGKLEMLRLCGAQPELKRGAPDELSAIAQACEAGRKEGFFSPSQYGNEANPAAYEKWFAPEIWRQTHEALTIFAAGLGTTGTLIGSARFFRRRRRKVTIVGAMCAPNEAVPGVRSAAKLEEISLDWHSMTDAVVEVRARESFRHSLQLCREGILGGPASGFALAGLCRFLKERKAKTGLDELRNRRSEVVAAFVCGDTPLPYLDKYSTYLEASEF